MLKILVAATARHRWRETNATLFISNYVHAESFWVNESHTVDTKIMLTSKAVDSPNRPRADQTTDDTKISVCSCYYLHVYSQSQVVINSSLVFRVPLVSSPLSFPLPSSPFLSPVVYIFRISLRFDDNIRSFMNQLLTLLINCAEFLTVPSGNASR